MNELTIKGIGGGDTHVEYYPCPCGFHGKSTSYCTECHIQGSRTCAEDPNDSGNCHEMVGSSIEAEGVSSRN